MGGLSKKAFLINGLVNDPKLPALFVNSGNLLFKTDALEPDDAETAKIAADTVVQATRKMGGTLAGIGSRDLAAGLPFLRQHHQPPAFTWLSLNLLDPAKRTPLFPPVQYQQAGDLKIAVLALTDHNALSGRSDAYQAVDWRESLPEVLAAAEREAGFILLLSNYSFVENKEIARNHKSIDLILQSGHAIGNMHPILINQTLISQVEIRGKYLGVLDIDWQGHGRWHDGSLPPQPEKSGEQLTVYSNRFIPLKPSVTNDPAIETLVRQTQQRIDALKKQPAR